MPYADPAKRKAYQDCYDCNLDKLDDDADTVSARNERIAVRMVSGELVVDDCEKVILHQGARP